jgi:DnaJ family protein C protein 13
LSTLSLWIPPRLVDIIVSNPRDAVSAIDRMHNDPDLIWNNDMRTQLGQELASQISQHEMSPGSWKNENYAVVYNATKDEIVADGLFVRLLVDRSDWGPPDPKRAMDALVVAMKKGDTRSGEPFVNAIASELQYSPQLADCLANHLSFVVLMLSGSSPSGFTSALRLLDIASYQKSLMDAFAGSGAIRALISCLSSHPDHMDKVLLVLLRLVRSSTVMVNQAVEAGCFGPLLAILMTKAGDVTGYRIYIDIFLFFSHIWHPLIN